MSNGVLAGLVRCARPFTAFILAVLLLPGVLAQESTPVLIERVDDGGLIADIGEPASAIFSLLNLNPADDFYVSVKVEGPREWQVVDLAPFFLAPRATENVTLVIEPTEAARLPADLKVTFSLVNVRTGEVTRVVEMVQVAPGAPPRVLTFFPNPLGPPLDNAWGTFLLDMGFWIAISIGAVFLGNTLVRMVTARASNATTREIITKLRQPVFFFVLFLGLASSVAVLPRNPIVTFIERVLVAVAVIVFGLYVLYRLLDGGLTYYQREIAQRTATKVDDVLVPVLRKIGVVVIYVVGAVLTLQRLGWDPTLLFAGAGIAGLVVAFAAQDTISNLFSGIFIMVDQPFREGDDIRLESGDVARVDKIGLRTTKLYIGRNHEIVVVPNNQLATNRVVNLAGPDERYWVMVNVSVSYDSDPQKVRETLIATARADPRVVVEEGWEPLVLFSAFGESSLDLVLRCAAQNYKERFLVASDLRFEIFKAFEREGIEIPFPQRVLHLKGEGFAR